MSTTNQVKTPTFRLSFPALFAPRLNKMNPSATPKYGMTMLIPKTENIQPLKDAMKQAVVDKWGADQTKWPKNLHNPIQDGDEKADWDGYEGHWFIRCTTQIQPPVYGPDCTPVKDQKSVYAGCYCRAMVHTFAWENTGKRGVSFGVDAVQKVRDGEPFTGGFDAVKNFGVVEGASSSEDPMAYAKPAADPFA